MGGWSPTFVACLFFDISLSLSLSIYIYIYVHYSFENESSVGYDEDGDTVADHDDLAEWWHNACVRPPEANLEPLTSQEIGPNENSSTGHFAANSEDKIHGQCNEELDKHNEGEIGLP